MKRKLKKGPIIILILIILVIIGITIGIKIINTINYHKTYEYKLKQVGYSMEEIKDIEKLKDDTKDYILSIEYDKNIISLIKEKYFIEKYFKDYLNYIKDSDKSLTDNIAIINVGANNEWYTNTEKADTSKDNLLLVNKFHYLDNSYNNENMKTLSNTYSYGENQMLTEDTYNAFISMFNDAKKEDLTLIVNSSYRSYEEQEEVYNEYKDSKGESYADKIAARAGFSEHQTGMAIDIQTYGSSAKTFEDFDEFKWLQNNAYKYGFILRYPKDKEYLTGYEYESWHYRYVGKEVAQYIRDNNITYDEYYAYFVK